MAAGIGVGILSIPLVASVSEDALRRAPGAARGQLRHGRPEDHHRRSEVVVPAAVSGLVAAFILAVSRAIGETMVVFIAGGAGGGTLFNINPLEPGLTMTAAMASQAAGHRRGGGRGAHVPEPVLRRLRAVPHHVRPQPHRRPLRAPGPASATRSTMALTTPATVGPRAAERSVARPAHRAASRLRRAASSRSCCSLSLGFSVARAGRPAPRRAHRPACAVLIDALRRLPDRHACARRPDDAGVFQGLIGHVLDRRLRRRARPSRSGSAPRSTSRSTPPTTGFSRFIDVNIRNLAGVPSVVYGILGLRHLREGAGAGSPAGRTRDGGRASPWRSSCCRS